MVRIKRLTETAQLPSYADGGCAGADLYADLPDSDTDGVCILPGQRRLIPTGLAFQLPPGWEAQIRPRSGLALKHGITVLNSPGTIDSSYTGSIGALLINLGDSPYYVRHGDRIAQVKFARAQQQMMFEVAKLSPTERGEKGFGSTGR